MKTNSVTEKTFGREQVIRIVIAAIAIALTYVFTVFVNITLPIAINGGLIHLGNVPLFLFAILFGIPLGYMGTFYISNCWINGICSRSYFRKEKRLRLERICNAYGIDN